MNMIPPIMLIIYAVVVTSMVLDFKLCSLPPKKQVAAIICLIVTLIINSLAMHFLGQPIYGKFYLFLVQLPIYVGFAVFSEYNGIKLFFVLLSIIIFSAPPIMCVTAMRTFFQINMATSIAVFFICYVIMILMVRKFIKPDFNYILKNCDSRHFWLFCLIPMLHYIYSFARTGYNFLQPFDPNGYWVREIPTVIVFSSYILLLRVFRITRENQQLENSKNIMRMQMTAAKIQINSLRASQEQTMIYRHDMRHHFLLLSGFAADGDLQKIKEYLSDATTDIETFTPVRYCENETVNLLLSSFYTKAKKENVTLCADVLLPNELAIGDTELCALFSNALENAISASAMVPDEKLHKVYIKALVSHDKLLISTENAYIGLMEKDGKLFKSQSNKTDHGFGLKSIIDIVERHNGHYSFESENQVFVLQLMLPLLKTAAATL